LPKFLENALRHEGRKKGLTGRHLNHYIFGAMNNLGAVKGNKITPKGEEMEKKHMADKKPAMAMEHMRITPAENGGHVVEHHFKPSMKGSGAFMERKEPESHVFGVGEGTKMMSHLKKHLGIGAAPSPKTEEGEMVAAAHEPPAAEMEEDQEGE